MSSGIYRSSRSSSYRSRFCRTRWRLRSGSCCRSRPLRPWASRSSAGSRCCGGRGRPELAAFFWSDWFPLALAIGAVLVAIAAGIAARRERSNENAWHALTLATAGYLSPFGYFWTTFLILSLPLAAETLRRAAARPAGERAPIVALVVIAWVLMEPQQTGTLVPILLHFLGVVLLFVLAIVTLMRPAPPTAPIRRPRTTAPNSP